MNVKQAVPFFGVASMEASLRFYMDGLGFVMKYKWIDEGKLRWCWLEIGEAALMLQEFRREGNDSWVPQGKVGEVSRSASPAKTHWRFIAKSHRAASGRSDRLSATECGSRTWPIPTATSSRSRVRLMRPKKQFSRSDLSFEDGRRSSNGPPPPAATG